MLAGLHGNLPFGSEENIHAGAKLDEADAFPLGNLVAGFFVANDAAGNQASDLREANARSLAFDGHYVALVLGAGDFAASDQKLALLVIDVGDGAGDGCAVHVHVEDIQEDADARGSGIVSAYGNYFSIGGGDGYGSVGDDAFGIAKKIEAERGQKEERHAERGAVQVPHCSAAGAEREGIIDPVDHHGHFYCSEAAYTAKKVPKGAWCIAESAQRRL